MIYSVVEKEVNMDYFDYIHVDTFKTIEGEITDETYGCFTRYIISGSNIQDSKVIPVDLDTNKIQLNMLETVIKVFIPDYDILYHSTKFDLHSIDGHMEFEIEITDNQY